MLIRVLVAVALAVIVQPNAALAYDVAVQSDTVLQGYDVRWSRGEVTNRRRRLFESLAVAVVRPPSKHFTPRITGRVELRIDHDFGTLCDAADRCFNTYDSRSASTYYPGDSQPLLDVPRAFIEVSELPADTTATLGRQLFIAGARFMRVDGVSARLRPVAWLTLSGIVGLQVRARSLLGSDAFVVPEYVPSAFTFNDGRTAWTYDPAAVWTGALHAHAELGHGVALHTGAYQRWTATGLSTRQVEGGAQLTLGALYARTDLVWDLLVAGYARAAAELAYQFGDFRPELSWESIRPTFDAGTIWVFFQPVAIARARAGLRWLPGQSGFEVSPALLARYAPDAPEKPVDVGGELRAEVTRARWAASGLVTVWEGDLGSLADAQLRLSRQLTERIDVGAYVFGWYGALFPDAAVDDGARQISVSSSLDTGYMLTPEARLWALCDVGTTPEVGVRTRALLGLSVNAWR